MCGIVGYVSKEKINLNKSLNLIKHRGPDNKGVFYKKIFDNYIGLGHVRLSIIDLDNEANQPFYYKNRYVIVFNGEIYNYIELRHTLEKEKYLFKTSSDTEVLIAMYDRYKEEMFKFIDGMFAFCIYDMYDNILFIARDHLGIKPMYYYYDQLKNDIFFSSELKALFTFSFVKKVISKKSITEFLLNGWLYEPDTGFEDIFKVMPGEFIIYNLKDKSLFNHRYYDIANKIQLKINSNCSYEVIEKLVNKSLKLQSRSDVPVGIFFSGGVDSTLIAVKLRQFKCLTAKYNKSVIKNSGIGNDYYYAKILAKQLDLNLQEVFLQDNEYSIDLIKKVVDKNEELIADFTYVISEKLAFEAKKNGYKVMLSGMGADEIFGGYPRYKAVKYKNVYLQILWIIKLFYPILLKIKSINKKIDRFISFLSEKNFIYAYSSLIGYFNKEEVKKILKEDLIALKEVEAKMNKFLLKVEEMSNYKKSFYLDLYGFLSHNFMVADKSSMQASIELRVPFANKDLLEKNFFCNENFILDFFNLKKQLKAILKKYVPKHIINRKKTGFNPPLDILIQKIGKDQIRNELNNNIFLKYCKMEYIDTIINDHFQGRKNNTFKIWQLLYLNYWLIKND